MPAQTTIAITGAGLVTSLGLNREASWSALQAGEIGLGPLTQIEQPQNAERGGGEVDPLPGSDPNEPREAKYLRLAIDEALAHAGIDFAEPPYPARRCGLMLGTTLHGMTAAGKMVRQNSAVPLRDFLAPAVIARATQHLPLEGFAATTCSACSSGLGSMLLGATLLKAGELDMVICGGYDPISEYAYAGFNSLRLVDERMPRPFANDRAGMKVSEGYGMVVLERVADAEARLEKQGRTPFAYLRGGGESADAHHLTQPMQDGSGAGRAIEAAIKQSQLNPDDVDLIVAHATGTPDNDAAEVAALTRTFGESLSQRPTLGLKSRLGHTLGAAGAAELIFAMLAARDGVLPTTANTTAEAVDFENLNVSLGDPKPATIRTTLNTSLGFGGANTCVVLSNQPDASPATLPATPHEVCITGVGVVLPGAIGNDAFLQHIAAGDAPVLGPIADDQYLHLLNARRVRRLSDYVKLTLASCALAFEDAKLDDPEAFAAECAGLIGTMHGSTHYSYDYYRQIVDDGLTAANPMLFAEGVPNAGAAHLSMMLKVKGACQSIIGSRTAGLDALRLATLRIANGELNRVVVCGGEEHDELVERCYAELGMPMQTAAGSVALMLESRSSAEARGARCHAIVEGGSQVHFGWRNGRHGTRLLREMLSEQAEAGSPNILRATSGVWTDRLESAALKKVGLAATDLGKSLPESFTARPLALVAYAALQADRSLATVLASDFNGACSSIRVKPA